MSRHRTLHATNSNKTVSSLIYDTSSRFEGSVCLRFLFCRDDCTRERDDAVETVAVGANITKQRALELAVELSQFVFSHIGEYSIGCCVELSALKDTLQKQIFQGRRQTTVTLFFGGDQGLLMGAIELCSLFY